ncbi:MAG: ThiF family adenylyltransferase [Clostridia bacterium]|nr:ThiF family adenylyltransferase [Clostridia bacterium]
MIDRITLQGFDPADKKAAVLGCGGLGCNIATHLVCAGIGALTLCDFDTVSESNLNRQFLYTFEDIGKEKVFLARDRLAAINPDARIDAIHKKIKAPEDLDFAAGADILFLAVDNNDARRAAQEFCRARGKALVNGGVNGFFGTAYLYLPGRTPDLSAAGQLTAENPQTRSVSSTVGVIGALEAHLGLRYLLGDTENAGKLHVFDGGGITLLPIRNKSEQ